MQTLEEYKTIIDISWQPIFFYDLMVPVPNDWDFDVEGGVIKAKHSDDEIRLKVTGWKIDDNNIVLENTLGYLLDKYQKAGYKAYGDKEIKPSYLLQKLSLDDEPCSAIASMKKTTKNGTIVLSFVFTTYDTNELNKHIEEINYILNNVAIRLT